MADNYLEVARTILKARSHPMTERRILNDAIKFRLLPEHLSGETM